MDSGPRTTVSMPIAVINGASVANATLYGGNSRFIRRCKRYIGNFDECGNRPSSGSKWKNCGAAQSCFRGRPAVLVNTLGPTGYLLAAKC